MPTQHGGGPERREPTVQRDVGRGVVQTGETVPKMLDAHPGKSEEAPHDQRVENARQRSFADYPGLQHHFAEDDPQPLGNVVERQVALLRGAQPAETSRDDFQKVGNAGNGREQKNDPGQHCLE